MKEATLPNKLREFREAAGLSQAALAAQVGVTKQSISDFETGERMPGLGTAAALARVLRSTVDALFLTGGSADVSDNTSDELDAQAALTAPSSHTEADGSPGDRGSAK
ncbi:MAG TPA: helix-turn-helix transcriptional regulator [Candidatus Limnocylindria bacterium]|jgi:putative transcriptional regulator|nr:helix-turn-helix transcriptional regulator [Candidatus Limnocylindria bacterium]